jgi:Domain of unknown function (DUF4390)
MQGLRGSGQPCSQGLSFRMMFSTNFHRRVFATFLMFLPLLWLITAEVPAFAKNARLKDIVVTNTRNDLLLYLSVDNCFTNQMIDAIQNGIPTTFKFFIRLIEKRDYAWDRKIADLQVSHTVHYDNLKKEYFVSRPEKDGQIVSLKDFEEVKKLMSEIVGLKVTGLNNLKRNVQYKMEMMAQLDKIELPFHLHYVLFFLSLWDFETDWYTVEFRY